MPPTRRRAALHLWQQGGLMIGLLLLLLWTVGGAIGYLWLEGWSLADSLYMSVITISTVGFGEVEPLSQRGRMFATFLIVGGLGTAVYTFTRLGQVVLEDELLGGLGRRRMRKRLSALKGHFILCGFGRLSVPIAEGLTDKGLDFSVIESNKSLEPELQALDYPYVIADATSDDALREAGIATARGVVTLLPGDAENLYVTMSAKALQPGVFVVSRASDENGEAKIRRGGANQVISPNQLASHRILQAAASPTVQSFMEHVFDRAFLQTNLGEAILSHNSELVGRSIEQARLRSDHRVTVVAVKRETGEMLFNPPPSETLAGGDTLVLIGSQKQIEGVEQLLGSG